MTGIDDVTAVCESSTTGDCAFCCGGRCECNCFGGPSAAECQRGVDEMIERDPNLRSLADATCEALAQALEIA